MSKRYLVAPPNTPIEVLEKRIPYRTLSMARKFAKLDGSAVWSVSAQRKPTLLKTRAALAKAGVP